MADYYGDYYGDYNAEADEETYDMEVDEQTMAAPEEEESGVQPLILAWGLVPVLDLAAGYWIYNDWQDLNDSGLEDNMVWEVAYIASAVTGGLGLAAWGGAIFMGPPFGIWFAVNIVLEAVDLYLVYRAEDKWPNDSTNFVNDDGTDASTQSTNFAYAAHSINLVLSAVVFGMTRKNMDKEEEYFEEYYEAEAEVEDEEAAEEDLEYYY